MNKSSVVIYKNLPALVGERDGDKFLVNWCVSRATATGKKAVYASQKVREKDVVLLCEAAASSIDALLDFAESSASENSQLKTQIYEIHELLLSDDDTASAEQSFSDMAELLRGELKADESWGIYSSLKASFEFEEILRDGRIFFLPRSPERITELKNKAYEKEHADELRAAFIERLKTKNLLPDDSKFMGDVEALALGTTDKSRTMKEAGFKETPEKAHKLLLDTKLWDITRNPYPVRWGLSAKSASVSLGTPPDEERVRVPGVSYAIDSQWSTDPDDAIAFDGEYLWVHIADPAAFVTPDSEIDKVARGRGATLYLPEGAARMLSEDCLEDYALGLREESRALSFKIKLGENGELEDCEVLRTLVDVKRLSYEKADELKDSPELKPLFEIARKNAERRVKAGAVNISIPEVHISVNPETKEVVFEPVSHCESGEVVREAMVLAGEGAAKFAFKNNLPFPFISQDAPEIPKDIPDGLAGQFRLRKCMRKRNVNVTPASHAGLGVGMYSQVTSPLRRYGDLLGHEQLRAFLKGEKLIDKDTMLMRMSEGDAAMQASKKAERNSRQHWTLVYFLQHQDWTGEAICVDKQPGRALYFIPQLGLETVIGGEAPVDLNGKVTLKAGKIDLPNLELVFSFV
ncbi:MAG: RNB domain-containing ribonuclease [Treponema sp.]|uniref:ribonuclease catalytic domain-containing protein n=1 Tax=Treponema sp. TaxID=166 RepID=UPI0025F4A6D6|nr:RNB domain-containing ribonuclease [Treponema sp.]MBQ9282608.1 RNB domain-containing ribonuclease [Treponema sp.]